MKTFLPNCFGLALVLALFVGCQSADNNTSKLNTPTNVAILFSAPKKPFYVINRVAANRPHQDPRLGYDSSRTWQDELQRQAAASGADAVIVDNASMNNINSVLITGVAIRYKAASADSAPPDK